MERTRKTTVVQNKLFRYYCIRICTPTDAWVWININEMVSKDQLLLINKNFVKYCATSRSDYKTYNFLNLTVIKGFNVIKINVTRLVLVQ